MNLLTLKPLKTLSLLESAIISKIRFTIIIVYKKQIATHLWEFFGFLIIG